MWFSVVVILAVCNACVEGAAGEGLPVLGPEQGASRVPAWDARGLGPLPRQG